MLPFGNGVTPQQGYAIASAAPNSATPATLVSAGGKKVLIRRIQIVPSVGAFFAGGTGVSFLLEDGATPILGRNILLPTAAIVASATQFIYPPIMFDGIIDYFNTSGNDINCALNATLVAGSISCTIFYTLI